MTVVDVGAAERHLLAVRNRRLEAGQISCVCQKKGATKGVGWLLAARGAQRETSMQRALARVCVSGSGREGNVNAQQRAHGMQGAAGQALPAHVAGGRCGER